MKASIQTVISHGSAVVAGFLAGRLILDIPRVSLDTTIDPVALVALCATLMLSAVLYRRFERGKYSDQLAKDAVLRSIARCLASLAAVENLVHESPNCGYHQVVAAVRACKIEFERYSRYASELNYPPEKEKALEFVTACLDLRDKLTDTPPAGHGGNAAISVSANRLTISPNRRVEIVRQIDNGRSLLHSFECRLIRTV